MNHFPAESDSTQSDSVEIYSFCYIDIA